MVARKRKLASSRNYGIDLLRLLSMLFVMILHTLLASGMLSKPEAGADASYRVAWLLETFCYGAVNIFAMISGYVGYREEVRPFKIKRLLSIWAQTVFYCLGIFFVIRLFRPDIATKDVFYSCIMPVTHSTYWYLTAFVLLFFAMPILDAGVRSLSKEQCRRAIMTIIVLMSATTIFAGDIFFSIGGYSFLWIAAMYLIGAMMKKTMLLSDVKIKWCLLGYLGLSVMAWAIKMFGGFRLNLGFFVISPDAFVSFCSPLIVIASMLLVLVFSRIKISSKFACVISYFAPCAFAAYILNSAPMAGFYIPRLLGNIGGAEIALPLKIIHILLFAFAFFMVAIVIDRARLSILSIVRKRCVLKVSLKKR